MCCTWSSSCLNALLSTSLSGTPGILTHRRLKLFSTVTTGTLTDLGAESRETCTTVHSPKYKNPEGHGLSKAAKAFSMQTRAVSALGVVEMQIPGRAGSMDQEAVRTWATVRNRRHSGGPASLLQSHGTGTRNRCSVGVILPLVLLQKWPPAGPSSGRKGTQTWHGERQLARLWNTIKECRLGDDIDTVQWQNTADDAVIMTREFSLVRSILP